MSQIRRDPMLLAGKHDIRVRLLAWTNLLVLILGTPALLAQTAPTAQAAEPAEPQSGNVALVSDSKDQATKEWYGMPIVVTDIAALGIFLGGMVAADRGSDVGSGIMLAGVGAYVLGGPIVHLTEHNVGKGFASLGLRAGAPLAGALTGAIVGGVIGSGRNCGGKNDTCALADLAVGGVVGLIAGGLVAMVIDDAGFAYKSAPAKSLALSVTPVYQPATRQTGLALRGIW
jgi:hypothetical protein